MQRRTTDVKPTFKTEELIAENDGSLWQGLITVGNPTQSFTVSFDTGSADLILPGPDCTTECKGRTKYDPEASSSSVDSGNFDIYGPDGSIRGEVYRDVVTLAGLSVRHYHAFTAYIILTTGFQVKNQTFGAALSYTSTFSSTIFPADGVLGMAFGGVSLFETTPLIQALFEQKEVTAPVFAFKLASDGAELSLGGPNSRLYSGSFTYVSVETEVYILLLGMHLALIVSLVVLEHRPGRRLHQRLCSPRQWAEHDRHRNSFNLGPGRSGPAAIRLDPWEQLDAKLRRQLRLHFPLRVSHDTEPHFRWQGLRNPGNDVQSWYDGRRRAWRLRRGCRRLGSGVVLGRGGCVLAERVYII